MIILVKIFEGIVLIIAFCIIVLPEIIFTSLLTARDKIGDIIEELKIRKRRKDNEQAKD